MTETADMEQGCSVVKVILLCLNKKPQDYVYEYCYRQEIKWDVGRDEQVTRDVQLGFLLSEWYCYVCVCV